jgi:hypothetical protein
MNIGEAITGTDNRLRKISGNDMIFP